MANSIHQRRSGKYLVLNDPLHAFLLKHRSRHPDDSLLVQLRRETAALGDAARMQISPEQGAFLRLLTAAIGARNALEIGTFTGFSSLCIARGLPPSGKLTCLDINQAWTAIARRYWTRAGLDARIDLRLGDAHLLLDQLPARSRFDLVFIDADKTGYDRYYEKVLPLVRPNGLILFDNMLWGGRLAKARLADPAGRALRKLNQKLAADPRVECVLLPVADGLQICRKR